MRLDLAFQSPDLGVEGLQDRDERADGGRNSRVSPPVRVNG
jgi:hypothetical protein